MGRLLACPSCSTYARADEVSCPQCNAPLRSGGVVARTAGAVLMGLSLTACPAEDDSDDTGASSATVTGSSSGDPTTMGSTTMDPTTSGPEPAYGVGTTDFPSTTGTGATGTSSGGDTDSGSSSSGDVSSTTIGGPEYGLPETTTG